MPELKLGDLVRYQNEIWIVRELPENEGDMVGIYRHVGQLAYVQLANLETIEAP